MKCSIRFILVLLGIAFATSTARALSLDRMGKLQPPDSFTCAGVDLDPSAGGMPYWKITLKGLCARLPYGAMVGWDPLQWDHVVVFGTYDYDSNQYTEAIYVEAKIVFSIKGSCQMNPWVHGSGASACNETNKLFNETGAVIAPPYPFSPKYMSSTLRMALAKNEQTILAGDPLQNWDPYENTGGAAALSIIKPTASENIDASLGTYNLEITETGFLLPPRLRIQIEQLEEVPAYQGDIKIPDAYSHWWQPLWNGILSGTFFPLPLGVSSGPLSGGRYRVRIRGYEGAPSTIEVGGWTDWRYFCVGVTEQCGAQFRLANQATAQLLSQKTLSTFGKNSTDKMLKLSKIKPSLRPAISTSASGFGSKVRHNIVPQSNLILEKKPMSLITKSRTELGLTRIKSRQINKSLSSLAPITPPKRQSSLPSPQHITAKNSKLASLNGRIGSSYALSVRSLSYTPITPREGRPLTLIIRFWNKGSEAGGNGQQYTVGCRILSGTRCPVQAGVYKINHNLQSRQELRVQLRGATPAAAGQYQITVALNGAGGRPFSQTIRIRKKSKLQPAAARNMMKLTPGRPSAKPARRMAPLPRNIPDN